MKRMILIENAQAAQTVFGSCNGHLQMIEQLLDVLIEMTDQGIVLDGDEENLTKAVTVCERLLEIHRQGNPVNLQLVTYLCDTAREGNLEQVIGYTPDCVCVTAKGRPIRSKTLGQQTYVKAIRDHEITFAIGPAGTGKTFLAVAMAVNAFRAREVSRIILTRPAVEAGEKLGFLPGDLQTKVDPYMRPLYDALHDLMGIDSYLKNMERGLIEVSPLAYMRGRTLEKHHFLEGAKHNTGTDEDVLTRWAIISLSSAAITKSNTIRPRSGLTKPEKILRNVEGWLCYLYCTALFQSVGPAHHQA